MGREEYLEQVYDGLAIFARRSRELSADLHPGLSLVAFTMLSYLEARPHTRAADIAAEWGLDKSTVSRQVNALIDASLLGRAGEGPGQRGQRLVITAKGRRALDAAVTTIRARLFEQLQGWSDRDVAAFARLIGRFNGTP